MTVTITPESHGQAACDALEEFARRTNRALEPWRGKDPGVDAYFACCEELRRADRARAATQPATNEKAA